MAERKYTATEIKRMRQLLFAHEVKCGGDHAECLERAERRLRVYLEAGIDPTELELGGT